MPAWLTGASKTRDLPVRRKVSWLSAVLQKLLPVPVPSMVPSLTDHLASHFQPVSVLPSKINFEPGNTSGAESSALPGPRPPRLPSPAGGGGAEVSAAPVSVVAGAPPSSLAAPAAPP